MNKIILPALVAALTVTAVAPGFASQDMVFDFTTVAATQDIEAQGFNVANLEEWGSLVVATVVDENGHSSFRYFDPDTLALVR